LAFSKEKAHERAEKFAAKGQHDKAAREYQTIVENDPKDIRAWLMLADCLVRSGDRNGAIDRYMQVAGYYSAQQQPQKALAVYRQVVNLDPRRFDVHQRIAQLNLDLGRVGDAVAIYEQLGQAQLQAGAIADALATFEIIANAEPAAVPKRLRVAELYSRERQVEKAVEHFRIAGDQLLQTGRHADFVRVAERLVYHQPDDGDTTRKLARVYLHLGDPRRALMKLNALLHADAHDRVALELLAETFLALEKPDKAVSVAVELVRQLVAEGEPGAAEAQRVARRATAWDPNNAELRAVAHAGGQPAAAQRSPTQPPARAPAGARPPLTAKPAPVAADGDDDDDDVSDDVVELDDADVIADGDPSTRHRTGGHAQQSERTAAAARSLTERVLSESEPSPTDGGVDLDKILFEARVYVKYRLFEHAIEHVTELLTKQPEHTGALALRARALGELGRRAEAAEAHVQVARLVLDRDPRLAREHLGAALDCDPNHVVALALRSDLDRNSRPIALGDMADVDERGDSGTFDLVGGDASGPISAGDDDFAIDVADSEPDVQPTRPISIETRFDLSDAGPLPLPDEQHPTENLAEALASARGFDASTEHADRTPLFGYSARPPEQGEAVRPTGTAAATTEAHRPVTAGGVDHSTQRFEPMGGARVGTGRASTRLVEPTVDLDATDDDDDDLLEDADVEPILGDSSAAYDAIEEPVTEEREVPIPPGKPLTPRRASTPSVWPDLQDELAEIRFFLDQGLDDDARAALGDLERKHPGHPEVAKLQAEFDRDTVGPQPDSGAKPLVPLPSEDEDEDAYLSAIFGGPKEKKKDKNVEIRAAGGTDPGDAASSYDLGMAYRDMGLVDDAIAQFEIAGRDAVWQARALVMLGTLRLHRGETDAALADLRAAIDAATNEDELFEAKYELAQIYETLGENDLALEQLHTIEPGYRERDAKIAALGG
jgi:tetratricopeptide (TPR) repeat protein